MTSPFVVAKLCVDNARGRCVFQKIVGFAERTSWLYRNFASWRVFDNQRRIVEAGLSGTRVFLAVFAIGGLFFVGPADAQRVSMDPAQSLFHEGRNAIDGCQSAPNPSACRRECYTTFGYGSGYRQCIWGD
jgi:hypothetical protein